MVSIREIILIILAVVTAVSMLWGLEQRRKVASALDILARTDEATRMAWQLKEHDGEVEEAAKARAAHEVLHSVYTGIKKIL